MRLVDYMEKYEALNKKAKQLESDLAGLTNVSQAVRDAVEKELAATKEEVRRYGEQNLHEQDYVERLKREIENPWK